MTCRHNDGPRHDCEYVDWRDSLIPVAEEMADLTVPALVGGSDQLTPIQYRTWSMKWDAAFHRAMQRLTQKREAA